MKSRAHDVFEAYPQLLTEMALRLPYQVKKISESAEYVDEVDFEPEWFGILCDYMASHQTPYVRRQARKLLLFVCGSREKYRELRDLHTLQSHMKNVIEECVKMSIVDGENEQTSSGIMNFGYDTLLQLIEHLKACVDVCNSRTQNWQKYCTNNENTLSFLFKISFMLDDGVSPIVLQLLQGAICPPIQVSSQGASQGLSRHAKSMSPFKNSDSATPRVPEKSKSEEPEPPPEFQHGEMHMHCIALVRLINKHVNPDLLMKFVERFLLECNSTAVRWQAHSLIVTLHKHSPPDHQVVIVDILWKLWTKLPRFGRKAAQFVDLLGYFSIKTLKNEGKIQAYVQEAVTVLKSQNEILANHPNAALYGSLAQLVQLNGY